MMSADVLPMRATFPEPPDSLGDSGKKAWAAGRELWLEGTLTRRDLAEWELYAEAFDEKDHCEAIVQRDGDYFTSAHGCIMEHPAIKRRQRAEAKIDKYSKLFGLVPEARKKRPAVSQGVATRQK